MKLADIKSYPKNAKKHPPKHIKQIADSIKEFGMHQPIVVDKQGVIIVGHGRYEACKLLGIEPEIKVVDLTEEQAKAYRLADNKLNESEWDLSLVIEELKLLSPEMLDLTGFDSDLLITPDEADDLVPDVPEEPQSKLGDLYELGAHRVFCGDSTKREDVEKLMDGKKAELLMTDPPYGALKIFLDDDKKVVGIDSFKDGKKIKATKYKGDYQGEQVFKIEPMLEVVDALGIKRRIIWGGNYFSGVLPSTTSWICWDKTGGQRNIKTIFSQFELAWTNVVGTAKLFSYLWLGFFREGERIQREHPTQKPIALYQWILTEWAQEEDIILDLFLGSGSTLIAAEKTGRICYGCEISESYCDVIVSRYCQYVGNNEILKNGEKILWEDHEQNQ